MIVYKGKQGICNFLKELWFYFKSNIVLNLKNIKKTGDFWIRTDLQQTLWKKAYPQALLSYLYFAKCMWERGSPPGRQPQRCPWSDPDQSLPV
jgi:hypothetical protein